VSCPKHPDYDGRSLPPEWCHACHIHWDCVKHRKRRPPRTKGREAQVEATARYIEVLEQRRRSDE
jgi:hypothetical protein